MLDFKELDKDGNDFELMIRELLYNKGLEVYWSGKGPDGGRDLLCIEQYQSSFKGFSRRWLVQCKHNAHSKKAVSNSDLLGIENSCALFNADGYLLVCSTFPSASVVNLLEGIEKNKGIITAFWDYRMLERQLLTPCNWPVVNMFFPRSAKRLGWQISKVDSDFWNVNYNGNIFYFSLRIGTNCDVYLNNIANWLDETSKLKLPKNHYLRLRSVYYDSKHGQYMLFIDYLLPNSELSSNYKLPDFVVDYCQDKVIDGLSYNVDLKIYNYHIFSDHFDIDHQDYYRPYISNFKLGMNRDDNYLFRTVYKDDESEFTEELKDESYMILLESFKRLSYVNVIKSINAKVEDIVYFSDNFSWENVIIHTDYELNNFFNVEIRFKCTDFNELCRLLSKLPISVNKYFVLEQHHIFIPDEGYCKDENEIYILKIMVHPSCAISKLGFRKCLNQYMLEIADTIDLFYN